MRRLLLGIALCTLALGACGKSEQTGNTSSLDEAVSAEDFQTSDVTAIDAATGADANMAADVDFNQFENASGGEGNRSATGRDSTKRRPGASASTNNASDEPAPEPSQPAAEPEETNSL